MMVELKLARARSSSSRTSTTTVSPAEASEAATKAVQRKREVTSMTMLRGKASVMGSLRSALDPSLRT